MNEASSTSKRRGSRSAGRHAVVIGAGIGGLAAAIDLAVAGWRVSVFEKADSPGGKLRVLDVDGALVDAGPTVLTMPAVFEELFADASADLSAYLTLRRADVLARHAWKDGSTLDLFADPARSARAIETFAGTGEARGFDRFRSDAGRMFRALEGRYIRAPRPSGAIDLARRFGPRHAADLLGISPFSTLWSALGKYFKDPRLRQLFGRYATYCGSSPFAAPATLMLVAHVEQAGVWLVDGGMHRLAAALCALASTLGVEFRFGCNVASISTDARGRADAVELDGGERVECACVVSNADPLAIAAGRFGRRAARATPGYGPDQRSLSAVTWAIAGTVDGFTLSRHNVFFSDDYAAEFRDLTARRQSPADATVYVCAQDRDASGGDTGRGRERLLCLVNAPADGDRARYSPDSLEVLRTRAFDLMRRCGLAISYDDGGCRVTDPSAFERLFPATGGALYGRASHGWRASFERPGSRSALPGLYLAGGATHPGPGLPLSALSGRLAASAIKEDFP